MNNILTKQTTNPSMAVVKSFILLLVILGLSACGHINLGTALALRNTNPATIDASEMRLALALPMDIPFTQAKIHLSFTKKGGPTEKIEVILTPYKKGPELASIKPLNAHSYVVVLAVPPEWYDDIEYYQAMYQQEIQAPTGASMSFGIDLKLDPDAVTNHCRETQKGNPITSWIRLDRDKGYRLLVRNSPLEKLFDFKTQDICK